MNDIVTGTAPAALICAPGSGSGKSVITAGLARLHRNAGRRVRVLKFGPDYLDPMVLERASGETVYQIHPWMTGEAECRWRLAEAAAEADLVLVESAMGLFDGDPSSADLAAMTGIPAVPVIDASGMAQTFAAIVHGLATYRDDVTVSGIIANRTGSAGHGRMLAGCVPEATPLLGAVTRSEVMGIPDRHLGIFQASEIENLDARLDAMAEVLQEAGLDTLPGEVTLTGERPAEPPRLLEGVRIGLARDAAFAFVYPANLDLLRAMGAEIREFSPIADEALPECDALWFPGGYPELYGAELAANTAIQEAVRAHHEADKPILAECGGLMYASRTLVDGDGQRHAMLGLVDAEAAMAGKLKGLGVQALDLADGELRGHTFHHSQLTTDLEPVTHTRRRGGSAAEAVYQVGAFTGSYFHGYFPSAPEAVAALFQGRAGHA